MIFRRTVACKGHYIAVCCIAMRLCVVVITAEHGIMALNTGEAEKIRFRTKCMSGTTSNCQVFAVAQFPDLRASIVSACVIPLRCKATVIVERVDAFRTRA